MQEEVVVQCPHCGENITLVVDLSSGDQNYVEDCSVCCKPIDFEIQCDGEQVQSVTASKE